MSKDSDPTGSTTSSNSFFKLMGFVKTKPELPEGWVVKQSATYPDRVYFFNMRTGATTWNPPGLVSSSDTASQKSISGTASETRNRPERPSKKKSVPAPGSKSSTTKTASTVRSQNLDSAVLNKTKQQPSQTYSGKGQNSETRNLLRKGRAETLCKLSQKAAGKGGSSLSKCDDGANIQRFKDSRNEYINKKRNLDEKLSLASPSPPWGIPLRGSNLGTTLTPESLTPRSLWSRGGPSDASSISSLSSKLGSPTTKKKKPARKKRGHEKSSSSDNLPKSKSKQLKMTANQKSVSETYKKQTPKKSAIGRISIKEGARTAVIQPQAPTKTDTNDLRVRLARCRRFKAMAQQPKTEERASRISSSKVPATLIPPKLPLVGKSSVKLESDSSAHSVFLSKLKARRVDHRTKDLTIAVASKQVNKSKAPVPSIPLENAGSTTPVSSKQEAKDTTSCGLFYQEPGVDSFPAVQEDGDDFSQMEIDYPVDDADSNRSSISTNLSLRIVLDTNALMHNLQFVRDLLDQYIDGLGRPILVIPWVVMQELDGLKIGSSKGGSAWKAVQFLHKCFMSEHPRVQGEPLRKVYDEADFEITCNDDWILQCCLQHQKRVGKDLVVLLSNDKHLCSKAVISGIKAFCIEKLLSGLEALAAVLQHRPPVPCAPSESPCQLSNDLSVTVPRIPSPFEASLSATTEKQLCDELVCKVKEALHRGLTVVLETEMKKAYDDLWMEIVLVKPPWSFQDVLRCFEKHWMAVFGIFLSKEDNRRFLQIMELTSGLQMSLSIVKTLINSSIFFCRKLRQHSPYDKALEQPILRLGELKKCCQFPPPRGNKVPNQISLNEETVQTVQTVAHHIDGVEIIPSVFEAIWLKILQLSALIFEGLGIPHDLETDKTAVIPSELECQACLNILCPLLQQLTEGLERVTEIPDNCIMEKPVPFETLCRTIHVFLNEFITYEKQKYTSVTTVVLQKFTMVDNNRQLLRNGIIQLTSAFTKLTQCQGLSS